ncbi:MAG: MATE family efflux transporter, partial [Gemmataceae bacterium]
GGLLVLGLLFRGRSGLQLQLSALLPDWELIQRLLRVSLPAAVDSLSVGLCQFWFLRIVNELGADASAAHGIALRLEALGYLAGAAFGTAATTIVSQNLGAQQPERAARGAWGAYMLAASVMSVMGLIFFVFARPMCAIFSPQNPEVIDQAVIALRTVAFGMPFVGGIIIFTAALRGAGDTRAPAIYSWIGFLGVRIPLAYLLTTQITPGLWGAWLAMLADLIVRSTLLMLRFYSGKWKTIRV